MSKAPQGDFRETLYTIDKRGNRRWVYNTIVKGRFFWRRSIVTALLMIFYLTMPWVGMNGEQAVLFDIPGRRFVIFGSVFWATDTSFLVLVLGGLAISLFFFTALIGRVWCGWACPETVFLDFLFRPIERLIEGGHAYAAEGHVLFAVASFPGYGKLSRRDTEEMLAGARVEVAPYKRDAGDFVLWKPSTDDLPGWDSPWGRGRPGWHIECSAMAEAHLGATIDIHAGGIDLQFPHHENEVAQSECAHGGAPFARWWLHNGMLNFGGAKMAKSVGNIQRVHDLVRAHPPEALRYALLSAHYRQPLEWSDSLIDQSVRTLDRLYGTLRDLVDVKSDAVIPDSIEAALDDDLNTPAALAEVARIAGEARKATSIDDKVALKAQLLGAGVVLGLLQQAPPDWFARGADNSDDARIQTLIDERIEAKKSRDFTRADAIREQLAAEGILLEDTPQGVRWKRA